MRTARYPSPVLDETAVDLHVKVLSEAVVDRAISAGLEAIVYAPHFTRWPEIRRMAREYTRAELLVVPGREIFTGSWRNRKHVLALGLEAPVPDFVPLDVAMDELKRQDAVVLAPHPGYATVSLTGEDLRRYRSEIHSAEIFNPRNAPWHDRRARRMVETLEIPPFASSYAHLGRTVGAADTTFERSIEEVTDLHDALRDGVARTVRYPRGTGRWRRALPELGHLCYENSVSKARRVLGSDLEATHPRHPAYGGRFEDVACV